MTTDRLSRVLSAILVLPGILHFVAPKSFDALVPSAIPGSARGWTYASGAAEIGLGTAILVPRTRRTAAGLAAVLFIAVFPANVNMVAQWVNKSPTMKAIAWARLPLQIPLVILALLVRRRTSTATAPERG